MRGLLGLLYLDLSLGLRLGQLLFILIGLVLKVLFLLLPLLSSLSRGHLLVLHKEWNLLLVDLLFVFLVFQVELVLIPLLILAL